MRTKKLVKIALLISLLFTGLLSGAQEGNTENPTERETVSIDALQKTLELSIALSEEAANKRSALSEEYSVGDFVQDVADIQRALSSSIILIAQTNPPPEEQQLAMEIAIGTKEAELALWYYIYGIMSNREDYIRSADNLLQRGIRQLTVAKERFDGR